MGYILLAIVLIFEFFFGEISLIISVLLSFFGVVALSEKFVQRYLLKRYMQSLNMSVIEKESLYRLIERYHWKHANIPSEMEKLLLT